MEKEDKKLETYSVYLENSVVEKAKKKLQLGQKLSPVINELLKKWIGGEIQI